MPPVNHALKSCAAFPPPPPLRQDHVAGRTTEGARLRRHVLRGAVLVFITAGALLPLPSLSSRAARCTPADAALQAVLAAAARCCKQQGRSLATLPRSHRRAARLLLQALHL